MPRTAIEEAACDLETTGFTRAPGVVGRGFGDEVVELHRGRIVVRAVRDRGQWRAERRLFGRWVVYPQTEPQPTLDHLADGEAAATELRRLTSLSLSQLLRLTVRSLIG